LEIDASNTERLIWIDVGRDEVGLEILIGAVVDAYDGLVADAEREVDLLLERRAGLSDGRATPGAFVDVRRARTAAWFQRWP